MSGPPYPFPYFWRGAWRAQLALKMQSTYVWLARDPTSEQREMIASSAPTPMKKAHWYGPVLVLLNFGSMENDLPSDYGRPRKRAIAAFTHAMDRWLLGVHATIPIRMVTNHVGDAKDRWHLWSVASFESETEPSLTNWFRADSHADARNPDLDGRIASMLRNAVRALFEADALTTLSRSSAARLVPALEAAARAVPLIEGDLLEYADALRGR